MRHPGSPSPGPGSAFVAALSGNPWTVIPGFGRSDSQGTAFFANVLSIPRGLAESFRHAVGLDSLSTVKVLSMAQRVNVVLVDDLDGSDATETVSFGLDGAQYEIDLSAAN